MLRRRLMGLDPAASLLDLWWFAMLPLASWLPF
jgi:hypothetical protein